MMMRAFSRAVFALLLSQFWISAASAEDETFLSDVLSANFVFRSGFQYQSCEADMVQAADRTVNLLSGPIGEFKRLSVPDKIKDVHSAVSRLHDLAYVDVRRGSPELPAIFSDPKVERGLFLRLKFLSESSRKKLAPHAREILVIAHRLLPMVAYVHAFSPDVQRDLLNFFDFALDLKPDLPLEKVDHDLRALAFGNLAILKTARLIERKDPNQSVYEALGALIDGMRESLKGSNYGSALESGLMVQQNVLAGIGAFQASELETVDLALVEGVKAMEALSEAIAGDGLDENWRVVAMIGQVEDLLAKPAMAKLPRYRAAVEGFRDQFRRPQDPKKVN
jgi:hypothetical protein